MKVGWFYYFQRYEFCTIDYSLFGNLSHPRVTLHAIRLFGPMNRWHNQP